MVKLNTKSVCFSVVYIGDVLNLCGTSRTDLSVRSGWKSLILLVPVRLGSDALNPAYTRCVKVCYNTHTQNDFVMLWAHVFSIHVCRGCWSCGAAWESSEGSPNTRCFLWDSRVSHVMSMWCACLCQSLIICVFVVFCVTHADDQLIYLDPHYCQTAVDVKQDNFPLEVSGYLKESLPES